MRYIKRLVLLSIVVFMFAAGQVYAGPITTVSGGVILSDPGAPSPTGLLIPWPIGTFPLTGVFDFMLNWSVLLTDGGSDGVSITQSASPGIVGISVNNTPVVNSGWPVFLAGSNGPFTLYSQIDSSNYGGQIGSVEVSIDFNGSGGGDQYHFTGLFSMQEIPAPSTMILFVTGLAVLGWLKRRSVKSGWV